MKLTKSVANHMKRMAGYVPRSDQERLQRRAANDQRAAEMNYPGWCGREDERDLAVQSKQSISVSNGARGRRIFPPYFN